MNRRRAHPPSRTARSRGAVALVALCFVSVLGIVLAGYFALSQQSMRLSNRSYGATVSAQLAELGLEEALRALGTNNFTDWTAGLYPNDTTVDWTLTGTTATATITLPATKYGTGGLAGSVRLRIDNYDASIKSATWNNTAVYRIGDLVGIDGLWYRCVQPHSNQRPHVAGTPTRLNLSYWVPAPIPWQWGADLAYRAYDLVNYRGIWYRCFDPHTNVVPLGNTSHWSTVPASRAWTTGTVYAENDVVRAAAAAGDIALYRCITAHTAGASFAADGANWSASITALSTTWQTGALYLRGALVFENARWYQCAYAHVAGANFAADLALSPPVWSVISTTTSPADGWRPATTYVVGDTVYEGGWYRCIADDPPASPPSAGWTNVAAAPYISWAWRNGSAYAYDDVVFHSQFGAGTWFRCTNAGASIPGGSSWENALGTSFGWSSAFNYGIGDTVHRSGLWYRCTQAHLDQAPPNAAYWSTAPLDPLAWDPGRHYVVNAVVTHGGAWYRSLAAHSGAHPVSVPGTWAGAADPTYAWAPATAYAAGAFAASNGIWYRCILANSNVTPNHAAYWTAVGACVVYAEGSAALLGEALPLKTLVRANVAAAPLVPNAVAATTTLAITGAGVVDSYDATRGTYNQTTGPFSALAPNAGFSAVLAGGQTSGTAVTVTNTAVRGYVAAPSAAAAPYAPLASFGGSATVGATLAGTAVELDRVSRSPFIPRLAPRPAPNLATAMSLANFPRGTEIEAADLTTTLNLGTPGATTPSRYFYNGDLDIGSAFALRTLNLLGPVILYVNGTLHVQAGGTVELKTTGSAEIHCASFRFYTDSSGIDNRTRDPAKLTLIADGATSTTTYLGHGTGIGANPDFYGVIYAPNTTAILGVEVQTGTAVYGAISARKVTFGDEANVHFDTTLRHTAIGGVEPAFLLSEWRELTNPAEKITLP